MKSTIALALLLAGGALMPADTSAQGLLKKLKDKANEVAEKALEKKVETEVNSAVNPGNGTTGNSNAGSSNNGSSNKATNKIGQGLKSTTPPDVVEQLTDAEKAHAAKSYNEARFSIQQALLGVELQIGKQILKSLPATVSSLAVDTTNDKVISTSWGWANLTIQRTYKKGDKELNVSIGNNQLYSGITNLYFNSGLQMHQSNGDKQDVKQIKVKGNKALIKYDDNEGYTVMVPVGQSGIIVWQGVNFATEDETVAAVNSFDIESIKKILGEK